MGKYDKLDPAAVAAQRRADIKARKPLAPKEACHYCGHTIPRLALWCSFYCSREYDAEKKLLDMNV